MKVLIKPLLFVAALSTVHIEAAVYSPKSFFHADTFTQILRPFEERYISEYTTSVKEKFWSYVVDFVRIKKHETRQVHVKRIYDAIVDGRGACRNTIFQWFASAEPQDQLVFIDILQSKQLSQYCKDRHQKDVEKSWWKIAEVAQRKKEQRMRSLANVSSIVFGTSL